MTYVDWIFFAIGTQKNPHFLPATFTPRKAEQQSCIKQALISNCLDDLEGNYAN